MQLRTEKPEITAKNYLAVRPGEYPCGNNLYLIVTPSGGRRWAFRYQRNGIVKKMGFGSAKAAGLKLSEAKDKAIDALRLLAKGTDPREHRNDEKRRAQGSRLFGEFAEEWRENYETGLKHKAARNKLRRIVQVICKPLHKLRLDEIETEHIIAVLRRSGISAKSRATRASGSGGIHLDVMHAPVHPVDHQPNPLAHLVAAKPFVEHPTDDALGRVLAVQDVARGMAVLRQPFALQRPVHGLDDVAALAKLPQHRLGLWRYNPFAGLDLGRQPHALQLARPLDQQGAVLAERVAHVLVGAQVGKLLPLLLGDQHPVEPGEAVGIHFPLKLLGHLKLGLPAQLPRNDLAGPFANAIGDIVAGDVEGLAVVGDAAHEDMGVRVAGVVVVDRDPVEFRPEVSFHLLHQIAGGLARVGQVHAVLCRDDEAELVAVIAASVEESATILHIALARIGLALFAVTGHAVAFEIAEMRVAPLWR